MQTRETRERQALFVAALAITRTTQKDFAARLGVTYDHLRYVLVGVRESPRIVKAVDQYIAKFAPRQGRVA
jgi:hypothetical protein